MARPFIFINSAMTADGKLDTFRKKGARISSSTDKQRVLTLRAEADAVMVDGHTLLNEDPDLTVKTDQLKHKRLAAGLSENPIKAGVVTSADVDPAGKFMTSGAAEKYIFTTTKTSLEQAEKLRMAGAKVFIDEEPQVDLYHAVQILYSAGVRRLMVEGGGSLNSELLRLGLVDEIYFYIAPIIFGGQLSPTLVNGPGFEIEEAIKLELMDIQTLDEQGGILIRYRVINNN